jgi:hypothetical protein
MGTIYVENGIYYIIHMREHNPPHIHAVYGEYEAQVDIITREIIEGHLPNRQLQRVQAWLNDEERQENLVKMFYQINPHLRRG